MIAFTWHYSLYIAVVAQKVKVQCWGPVWSEKVGMGWWWISNRSGWLLELLTKLSNSFLFTPAVWRKRKQYFGLFWSPVSLWLRNRCVSQSILSSEKPRKQILIVGLSESWVQLFGFIACLLAQHLPTLGICCPTRSLSFPIRPRFTPYPPFFIPTLY